MTLTTLVGSEAPFQEIVEPAVKPAPFTVSVKPGLPASAVDGISVLIVGVEDIDEMVKIAPLDTAPLVFTLTVELPWEAMKLAAIDAVN